MDGIGNALGKFNNAVLSSASSFFDMANRRLEEQAKYDASNIQIRLEREANNYMRELQKSNSYETWYDDMDGFFDNCRNEMENKDSGYYCRNNYTAKLVDSLIESTRNSYQDKIARAMDRQLISQNLAKYNESSSIIDQTTKGQENIDKKNALLTGLLINGDINSEQYQGEKQKNYLQGTLQNYVMNFNDDIITAAIGAGKDFESFWPEFEKTIIPTKYYDMNGLEQSVDTSAIKEEAKKECQQLYNSKLYSLQNDNYNKITSDLTDIKTLYMNVLSGRSNDIQAIKNRCSTGINTVNQMSGNLLAKGEQKRLADEYLSMMKSLENLEGMSRNGSFTTSGASGSSAVTAYSSMVKAMPDMYFQAVKDGNLENMYAAKDALQEAYNEAFFSKSSWSETKGMTSEEAIRWYNNNYSKTAASKLLNNETLNKIIKTELPEIEVKFDNLKKDIEKDFKNKPEKRKYSENAINILSELCFDLAATSGKGTDKASLVKKFDQMMNAITVSKMDDMFKEQRTGLFGESDEKFIARTSKELSENDVVFTTVNGEEKWAPGAKEKIDSIAKRQKEIMSGQLDKELEFYEYKKVGNDVEPIPLFKDKEGNVYHYESDEKGKNASIVDQNGRVIEPIDTKAKKEEAKAMDKAAKDESKQKQKEANAEYNKVLDERNEKELKKAGKTETKPKGLTDLNPEVWKYMTDSERKSEIQMVIERLESGNKKTLEIYGVTKEEVEKMSREERFNLVIGK
jgi:hypothetical protein